MAKDSKSNFVSTGRSLKGGFWIWLSAGGLSLGIIMILALLTLVTLKGVSSYWPRPIEVIEVKQDEGPDQLAGIVIQQAERKGADGRLHPQLLVFQGTTELHNQSYHYVDVADILERKRPSEVVLVDRLESGPAILWPVALETTEGRYRAGDTNYSDKLQEVLGQAKDLRRQILQIKRRDIGSNSRALQDLLLAERTGKIGPGEAQAERLKLQAEYETLQKEVIRLSTLNQEVFWIGHDIEGRELRIPARDMLHVFAPNSTGFWGKLGEMGRRIFVFLSENPRNAGAQGGVYPAIVGTVVLTLLMTLFVTPLGVVAAIYLSEYAREGPLVRLMHICVNNLAGVPAIVFGVFGLAFFVYFVGEGLDERFFSDELEHLNQRTFGTPGILWASLTMALLTLPVVIVTTEEALSSVPRGVRDAALACGASKWQAIQRVVLPASLPGILTGVILAMARGAAEVAPLMLVGAVELAPSLPIDDLAPYFHPERKFMHLGYHIYELGMSSSNNQTATPLVYATALLLILVILVLNLAAILLRNRLHSRNPESYF